MNKTIKQQIIFILEDDNEIMTAALNSDLDEENKQMKRVLINQHQVIIEKVKKNQIPSQHQLQLIRDANEIHLNDTDIINGNHSQAVELDRWLDMIMKIPTKRAFDILQKHLDKDKETPAIILRALHALWEEIIPNGDVLNFDDSGKCLKCGSKVFFADVTDTLVYVGNDIVKRYDGDITNRNCVKCNYTGQYQEYKSMINNRRWFKWLKYRISILES